MARKRIDELTAGTSPLGTSDLLLVSQAGKSRKVALSATGIATLAADNTFTGANAFDEPLAVGSAVADGDACTLAQAQALAGGSSFTVGDIKQTPIPPAANGAWVDLDTADQTISTTNYTFAGGLRDITAKIKIGGTTYTSWTGTVSGSNVTIATTDQGKALVAVIAAALASGCTLVLNVAGTDYAVVSATYSTLVIVVTGSPTTGSQTCIWYPYRTTSATQVRLHAESGLNNSSEFPYTPTATGLGTVASVESYGSKIGPKFVGRMRSTIGTPTGTEARESYPYSLVSSKNITTLNVVGDLSRSATDAAQLFFASEPESSYMVFTAQSASFTGLVKRQGSEIFGTGNTFSGYFSIPMMAYEQDIPNIRTVPLGYAIGAGRAVYAGAYTA